MATPPLCTTLMHVVIFLKNNFINRDGIIRNVAKANNYFFSKKSIKSQTTSSIGYKYFIFISSYAKYFRKLVHQQAVLKLLNRLPHKSILLSNITYWLGGKKPIIREQDEMWRVQSRNN